MQSDAHQQATWGPIGGDYGALARLDAGLHDGQTETDAASLTVSRCIKPIERVEDALEFRFGDAGTVISNRQYDIPITLFC